MDVELHHLLPFIEHRNWKKSRCNTRGPGKTGTGWRPALYIKRLFRLLL